MGTHSTCRRPLGWGQHINSEAVLLTQLCTAAATVQHSMRCLHSLYTLPCNQLAEQSCRVSCCVLLHAGEPLLYPC
jgi:hypothetical protein